MLCLDIERIVTLCVCLTATHVPVDTLRSVHSGDYSRRIWRLLPKTGTAAEFGNSRRFRWLLPNSATNCRHFRRRLSATIVSSVDRALGYVSMSSSFTANEDCSRPGLHVISAPANTWTNSHLNLET